MASPSELPTGSTDSIPSQQPESSQFPQLALLDFFFPGFSVFAGAVQKYLHVDLNLYIPLLLLFGALTVAWNYTSQYFWDQVETYFMSSVDIRTDDEIYNVLMAWVAAQRFAQGARRFVVNTNLNSRSWYLWRWDYDEDEDETQSSSDHKAKKKSLSYTPSFGSHYFWYRGRVLLFKRNSNREQSSNMLVSEREEISISCFGRNPWILKELLMEARVEYQKKDEQKTLIYQGTSRSGSSEPTWQRCMARTSRPFSTVILNEKTKNDLIEDVTDYLDPATRRWYSNRGIPYRRGYLLYGPPGTGKSSLSLALAGFFKMRIYIVSLSSVTANEENLASLFAELPRRCVVLLEDIDTAGLTHTREENKTSEQRDNSPMVPGQITPGNGTTTTGRLSLSGLLNILDGVASQEGRVLIMTTNHLEKLDKALIRPGRVDMIVRFGLADSDMIGSIFRAIFAPLEGDESPEDIEERLGCTDPEKRRALIDAAAEKKQAQVDRVQELALDFARKIPAHEFSPAELQGHLMRHKRDAEAAVAKAEEWVEQARKEKKEKELVAAEEKRKAEEEEKKKKEEEEKKKEEEEKKDKEKEKEKRKEERREKKKGEKKKLAKKASSSAASDSDSGSSNSSGSGSGSESEAEGKRDKKKAKTRKGAKEEKAEVAESAIPAVQDTNGGAPKTALKVKSGHERKDSGYVTPASVEA